MLQRKGTHPWISWIYGQHKLELVIEKKNQMQNSVGRKEHEGSRVVLGGQEICQILKIDIKYNNSTKVKLNLEINIWRWRQLF